jgi:cystathionine gamma-synthase
MMKSSERTSLNTWLVNGARRRTPGAPLNVPPVFASNFYLAAERVYSRGDGTETTDALEDLLGHLDRGRALVFGSGMAAASAVLGGMAVGSHLVIPPDPYHGVAGLVEEGEAQGRWTVTRIDQSETGRWLEAAADADLIWLESPSNPMITVADLPAICAAPRKDGARLVVDSTFATPLNQRPLDFGADIVLHSATKFIGGHSDLLAGVLIVRDEDIHEDLHHRRLLQGGIIGGMEAFLTLRGARTLALRMERSQANALELAQRLEGHPEVDIVRYPGLAGHAQHQVAASFMDDFGAMMAFEPTGPGERASAVCDAVRVVHHATSLGGVESSMERRAIIPGQESIPPSLIRFSVGCEDVEDLWDDLDTALSSTATI